MRIVTLAKSDRVNARLFKGSVAWPDENSCYIENQIKGQIYF